MRSSWGCGAVGASEGEEIKLGIRSSGSRPGSCPARWTLPCPLSRGLCSLRGMASPGQCTWDSLPVADSFSDGFYCGRPYSMLGQVASPFPPGDLGGPFLPCWVRGAPFRSHGLKTKGPSALAIRGFSTTLGLGSRIK